MDERFLRVCDLFESSRHISPGAERTQFLDASCEEELRAEVESMLRQHESSADVDSIAGIGPELTRVWEDACRTEPMPERIGPYPVLREIGSGGSGTVYEAQQSNPTRRVAIKVLNATVSPDARQRFEREGEILAELSHDGIARVFSIEDSAIVMEMVDGLPLTQYADDNELSTRQRLKLLVAVCRIIAHAHRRGVIHRDLKPSNILVTQEGEPKVLDFGLARRMETDDRTVTGTVMGTLGYMSPEQASARPDSIDTRTDVYALGVLGFRLLSGRLPHETENRPVPQVLVEVARDDAPTLGSLDKKFRGDLSLVFMRALAREPERRYQSAEELAADIERYLADEPIVARSPTATYQIKRFVKRNKAFVSGLAGTFVALAVGLALALRFARDAERNAAETNRALAAARIVAAANDLRSFRPRNARRVLDLVPNRFRNWEWRYLNGRFHPRVPFLSARGLAPIYPTRDSITLWNDPEWRPLLDEWFPSGVAVDGDQLWDIRTNKPLPIKGNRFHTIASSRDGSRFAVLSAEAGKRGRILVVDRASFGIVLDATIRFLGSVAMTSDGTIVAWSNGELEVSVVDLQTRERSMFDTGHFRAPYSMAFSPDNRHLATGTYDGSIRIHDWRKGKTIRSSRAHTGSVYSIAYSPNGTHLAAGSFDQTASIWNLSTGDSRPLVGHASLVRFVRFSKDGEHIWTVDDDGARKWRVRGAERDVLSHHADRVQGNRTPYVYGVAISPDGRSVASAGWDETVRRSDLATGRLLATAPTRGDARAVRYTGKHIVIGSNGGTAIWDGRSESVRNLSDGFVESIEPLPDGSGFLISPFYRHSTNMIIDPNTGTARAFPKLERPVPYQPMSRYSPDGAYLALAMRGSGVRILDGESGETTRNIPSPNGSCAAIAFGPKGRYFAAGLYTKLVLFDAKSFRRIREMETGHQIYSIAFRPDGKRIATGLIDSTIPLWDPVTGTRTLVLRGHREYVYDLAWSPDGGTLASASGDNTVRLWRGE